jgi:hypothetical protein
MVAFLLISIGFMVPLVLVWFLRRPSRKPAKPPAIVPIPAVTPPVPIVAPAPPAPAPVITVAQPAPVVVKKVGWEKRSARWIKEKKLITKSDLLILAALIYLEAALYKAGIGGWEYRLLVYVPGIILLSHILEMKERRKTALAMVIVAFAVWGTTHGGSDRWLSWARSWPFVSASTTQTATNHATDTCSGKAEYVTLDSRWRIINPTRSCRIVHDFPSGSVEFDSPDGGFASAGWQKRRTLPASIRASAGTVSGYISLCPVSSAKQVNWDCSSL